LPRSNKYSAEHHVKHILRNDRPVPHDSRRGRTRTERHLLPAMVAEVSQFNDTRRRARRPASQAHIRTAQYWRDGYERMATSAQTRTAGIDLDAGLEL
jgi:hypothetical protein